MRNGNDIGVAARLTDLLVGDGDRDSDLLMQRNTQQDTVMQWLLALDMQVMGACRADERLKPLLKFNASSVAEDRLLSHLSQHFEPSEVGLLARCLCIPLASVRVGKIKKIGTLLTPTSTRGNLVISLLPTSDLRISFLADDGYTETLSTLRNTSDCSSVMVEGIPKDSSGRSFAVRIPNKDPFYFWCSEKSRLLGNELLDKMKHLLERKPSLAELTGITDSRLERFVHHLRTNFLGSNTASEVGQTSQSQNLLSKPSRSRSCNFQVVLSPRPSSFKLRRRTDGARIETSEKHPAPCPSTSNHGKRKLLDSSSGTCLFPSLPMPSSTSAPRISPPYYCWCPPVVAVSTLQTESFSLPPLSSLLPNPSPNLFEIPILPLSMSSSSQQIPVFTPLMCDSIVHLPVIDICSSGQAYLVNSGPAISVSIPPLHNPLIQETDSEKSARDTLRVLISGSGQFPSVIANSEGNVNVIAAMSLVSPGLMRRCIEQGDLVETGGAGLNKDDSSEESSGRE
ncbi:hypothetical protein L1987_62315 [Smallanthus sonchifolius]|uniref:Uncharacterized protein n=1 Tax=Smallanthus sonchifolius TaxID=185202 RepID=A0ACB9CA15_9ASTR|nr:hypothetical protein L1987_62315 [Smallanthus sonchifolius]